MMLKQAKALFYLFLDHHKILKTFLHRKKTISKKIIGHTGNNETHSMESNSTNLIWKEERFRYRGIRSEFQLSQERVTSACVFIVADCFGTGTLKREKVLGREHLSVENPKKIQRAKFSKEEVKDKMKGNCQT